MIPVLIAAGFFEDEVVAETGTIIAAAEDTVLVPKLAALTSISNDLPLGALEHQRPLDPSSRRPFAVDLSAFLPADQEIGDIVRITMSAAGAAVGVIVESASPRQPIVDESGGRKLQYWLSVVNGSQGNAAFSGAGLKVGIAFLIRTNGTIPQDDEHTVVHTVRHL